MLHTLFIYNINNFRPLNSFSYRNNLNIYGNHVEFLSTSSFIAWKGFHINVRYHSTNIRNNEILIFLVISNQHMDFHKEDYIIKNERSLIKVFIHMEKLTENIRNLQDIFVNYLIINVVFIVETCYTFESGYCLFKGSGIQLSSLIKDINSLNPQAIFHFIIGSCYGIYMHQYIFDFKKGSTMITFSYYRNSTYKYPLFYYLSQTCNNFSDIITDYVLSFQHNYDIPLIFFSYFHNTYQLRSVLEFVSSDFLPDVLYYYSIRPRQYLLENFQKTFVCENLSDAIIEEQKKAFFHHILIHNKSFYRFKGINPFDLLKMINHEDLSLSSFVTLGDIGHKYPYEYHYQNLYSIKGFKLYWTLNQEILWYFQDKNTLYNRKIKGNINY